MLRPRGEKVTSLPPPYAQRPNRDPTGRLPAPPPPPHPCAAAALPSPLTVKSGCGRTAESAGRASNSDR